MPTKAKRHKTPVMPKRNRPGEPAIDPNTGLPPGVKPVSATGHAIDKVTDAAVPDVIEDAVKTGGDIVSGVGDFVTTWLLHPERLLKVILGAVLIIMGVSRISKAMTGTGLGGHIGNANPVSIAQGL